MLQVQYVHIHVFMQRHLPLCSYNDAVGDLGGTYIIKDTVETGLLAYALMESIAELYALVFEDALFSSPTQ